MEKEKYVYTIKLAPIGQKLIQFYQTDAWCLAQHKWKNLKIKCFHAVHKNNHPPFVIELWSNGFLLDRMITIQFWRVHIEELDQTDDYFGRKNGIYYFHKACKQGFTVNLYRFNGHYFWRKDRFVPKDKYKHTLTLEQRRTLYFSQFQNGHNRLIVRPQSALIPTNLTKDWFQL